MSSVNKVIIVGNLGDDPKMNYASSGDAIANMNVATTETWKDKKGNKQEKTEWIKVVMYRKLAEIAGEYLRRGSKVYIEGKIQTRKWTNKDGADQYTTEIIANEMKMLGGKTAASGNNIEKNGDYADIEDDIPF